MDDRPLSPGAKLKDLDLLGFPLRVVVGRKAGDGVVEATQRRDAATEEIPVAQLSEWVSSWLKAELRLLGAQRYGGVP